LAERARSFDRVAEEYERARPEYPPTVLDGLPLTGDAEVLDLGAGTGKLTRLLTQRYRRVIAVEPLDGMRAILERVVPDAESRAGSAEAIPLADRSINGVFDVAPPWHDVIARGPFGEVRECSVPHDHLLDRAGVLDNARSVSWVASRTKEERELIMRRLGELIGDGPFAIPNRANIMWAVRA